MSKAIRDKMDKLNTLSGGIVFGKEETWERLQGKLDEKPARRIALGYKVGLAAAAVLLLSVCITVLYNKTEDKIAAAPALYQYDPTQPTPSTPAAKNDAAGIVSNEPKEVRTIKRSATKTATIANQPLPAPDPVTEAPEIAVNNLPSPALATIAVPAPKQKMRTVHINEADNEAPAEQLTYASSTVNTKTMKVVSLNEEGGEQPEIAVKRTSRPHGTLPFFIPPSGNAAADKDMVMAHNPFNIKLSIQN